MPQTPDELPDDATNGERIGALITLLRDTRGWSRRDLEMFSGVSRSTLDDWEEGRVTNPQLEKLQDIAEAFDAKLSEFLSAAGL